MLNVRPRNALDRTHVRLGTEGRRVTYGVIVPVVEVEARDQSVLSPEQRVRNLESRRRGPDVHRIVAGVGDVEDCRGRLYVFPAVAEIGRQRTDADVEQAREQCMPTLPVG